MKQKIISQDTLNTKDKEICNRVLECIETEQVDEVKELLELNPHLLHVDFSGGGWMNAAVYVLKRFSESSFWRT